MSCLKNILFVLSFVERKGSILVVFPEICSLPSMNLLIHVCLMVAPFVVLLFLLK